MKKIAVVALLLGTVGPAGPAAQAGPNVARAAYSAEAPAVGPLCSLDASGSGPDYAGTVSAGPLTLALDAPHTGRVTCTVQVGGGSHDAADAVAVSGPATPGVAAAAGPVTFTAGPDQPVYLCTALSVDGGPDLYWDDADATGLGSYWSQDPAASCGLAFGPDAGAAATLAAGLVEDHLPAVSTACSDGVDNDHDGAVDYPDDLGCSDWYDPSEAPAPPQCSDGVDNDHDGAVDYPADSGCLDPLDVSERTMPQTWLACSDGLDNDGDGLVDFPQDKDCASPLGSSENPSGCLVWGGHSACASYSTLAPYRRFTVHVPTSPWARVVGGLDWYDVPMPDGSSRQLLCVVLTKDGSGLNPCQSAGGRYLSRQSELAYSVGQPNARSVPMPVTVDVCTANLTLSLDGVVSNSFNGLTLC
jgi:hypothetical protein